MKKLIFSTALMLTMVLASYGKPADKNSNLLKGLSSALNESKATATFTSDNYKKASFTFNGKTVNAYYDVENDDLIGFSIPMSVTDLPQLAAGNIKAKFENYTPDSMVMFIRNNGYFAFYVSLTRPGKPSIIVTVSANGKAQYFGKM